jgi:sugar lactone lactonase YvrE
MRIPARSLLLLPLLVITAGCAKEKPEAPLIPPVRQAILTTVGDSASTIEGVALANGMLYVCDWKDGTIYRIDPSSPAPVAVGGLPIPAGTSVLGMVTDSAGGLYLAVPDPGVVYRVAAARLGAADFDRKKDATVFATGVKGANGLAFDRAGHLWITGGGTGNLYHVGPAGGAAAVFASNYSAVSTDTTIPVRGYVVNGIAFDSKGGLYTANTGTGEITKIAVGPDYTPGAIGTFVKDPRLIGADGLLMDSQDNLWVDANYRNTLARVGPDGTITIVASSMPGGAYADSTMIPAYPQEGEPDVFRFPAELKIVGQTAYLANLNFPIGMNAGQSFKGASIAAITLP